MYISPTPASDSATYKERITFVTSYENQVIDLFLSVSSEAGDFGLVCPIDVAYTDNVTALWRKSGIVSETLSITVPFSGSHFIDIVYKKDSSLSRNEDRMKYLSAHLLAVHISHQSEYECFRLERSCLISDRYAGKRTGIPVVEVTYCRGLPFICPLHGRVHR